ncbi:hypothetical protein GGR50DRAFT_18012 [Xylaria sp. CBS 124048]|nr:hypothetical protein GGR50DRAFT_18012 [Xylaria sp. CBS 124048]
MSYRNRRDRNDRERHFNKSPSPPGPTEVGSVGDIEGLAPTKKRQPTVYDAVAGRVTTTLPVDYSYSKRPRVKHHKRPSPDALRDPTLAPEEALFRRSDAPVRFVEKDIYRAHENLPDGGRDVLPDSDLVKNVHSYASHFYGNLPANQRYFRGDGGEGISERSMDETALLAFGMLLEEAGREALGENGDLVFTEGAEMPESGDSRKKDEDAEVFGFLDAPRYENRAYLKRQRRLMEEER